MPAMLAAMLLVLAGAASTASAADQPVVIAGFSFSPTPLTINVGDTVTWTNSDTSAHTTTSDTGVWDSGGLIQGGSFQKTFIQAGFYAYHCSIHSFMQGAILVGTRTYLPLVIREPG
jgi:plastocyanin